MLKDGAHAGILCSDLVMPGVLNGLDLAAKIATDFPYLKVLITSGHANDVVTDALIHDMLFDILQKPYRQSDLAERLSVHLAGSTGV